jgi:class 3 adenylate cyclase/tetratricopeptide (TPR) repeat protein
VNCPSCGELNPAGFRFCGSCGAPLAEAAPARQVRKVVTVVFCDLSGSTALGTATDPEALRAVMRGYYEQMRAILERHGGTVEKFIGDAVMAVFGVPVAHEDDALRAVRAAWEMRAAVPALGLRARIGVNTGEVVAGEGDTLVTGDAVNVAARLEQAAEVGEVLIGASTRRLVRDAVMVAPVEVQARGKPEPVTAFRLENVDPHAASIARRLTTPLVGRQPELEQLKGALHRAVRERRCQLFTVLGVAGVGKSRLVREFLASADATVLEGRCLDYGEGITFWPVVSVLKQLGERAEATLASVVAGASTPNELFWKVRSQLEEVALERPLIVCFDDIQWGEETFLDLVDHIADLSRGTPLLVLCLARPELLDKRPGWGGGKLNATTILLEPLTATECAELIAVHGDVEAETRERILAAADGNPLFVEEMVALVRDGEEVHVPGTVQALLQARLDQLDRDERTVIEHGAVEGQVFHRGAVVALAEARDVDPQLVGLVRKELIRPETATLEGDHAFRFRHLLIRDAAYDALPKETRALLHERFADWLERHGAGLIELDEVLGYHYEQAARYLRELDRPSPALEHQAGTALAAAGSRAAARTDVPGALNLLRRASALLPKDDERRAATLLEQLVMLSARGHIDERLGVIDELEGSPDERLRMHGRVARLFQRLQVADPEDAVADAEQAVAEALAVFEAAGDELGMAHAHQLTAMASWLQSRAVPTVAALDRVIEHARRARAAGLLDNALLMLTGPLGYGPFQTGEVRARLDVFRLSASQTGRYSALTVESHLAARGGDFDEALDLTEEAGRIAENLGLTMMHVFARLNAAHILRSAGQLDEAADAQRWVNDRLEELGQAGFRSTALLELARVVYEQHDPDEAERLAAEGEALGATEDVINHALGQALRAVIAADRGYTAIAEQLAREALEYAYRTDFPGVHADAHETLARVLSAAGRPQDALAERRRALELWERYDYTSESNRVRALLTEHGLD